MAVLLGTLLGTSGCSLGHLSDAELREFEAQQVQISRVCRQGRPGPDLDRRLQPVVERAIELAAQNPDQTFDPVSARSSTEASDSTTLTIETLAVAEFLAGDAGTGVCSRPLAQRVMAAVTEMND